MYDRDSILRSLHVVIRYTPDGIRFRSDNHDNQWISTPFFAKVYSGRVGALSAVASFERQKRYEGEHFEAVPLLDFLDSGKGGDDHD